MERTRWVLGVGQTLQGPGLGHSPRVTLAFPTGCLSPQSATRPPGSGRSPLGRIARLLGGAVSVPHPTELRGPGSGGWGRCVRRGREGGPAPYPEAGAPGARRARGGPPGRAGGRAHRREPLGGTVPASSGHSPGSQDRWPHLERKRRQGRVRPFPEAALSQAPPPPQGRRRVLAIVLGERNQEDKQPATYRNFPAPPTPQGPLPSGSQPSGRKRTLADRQTNSPGQGRSASTSCLWSRGAHSRRLARWGAPRGGGAQGSLWLRSSQGCWDPPPPAQQLCPPNPAHQPAAQLCPPNPARQPAARAQSREAQRNRCRPGTQSRPTSHLQPVPRAEELLGLGDLDGGGQSHLLWIQGQRQGVEALLEVGGGGRCSPNHRCQGPGAPGTLAQFLMWGPDPSSTHSQQIPS